MAWLKNAPSQSLQHALKDLEKAYKNFFAKRADFPRFKRKGSGDSFRYPDPKQLKLDQANNRIFLPKLGWLRYRNSCDVSGELRNVTVSQSGGKGLIAIASLTTNWRGMAVFCWLYRRKTPVEPVLVVRMYPKIIV
jgi:putative transposase